MQLLCRQDKHNSDAPHIICEVKEWQIQEKTAGAMCCGPARVRERMAVIPRTYMGYGALVSATAPALGLTYGGIVNQTLGWRYIFVLLVPVLIITLISIRLCSLQEL